METYQIAIYMRLSKEDNKEQESNSITTQRILLQKFVAEHFSNYQIMEFCDDGYTGTNFERPEIQKLLQMAKELKINCIIVKDFSRFARDYIELGSYLEQIFPFLGVRFISINDNYDSEKYHGTLADIDINFKNLLYDLYSKDLSQKVKTALSVKKESEQYVSSNSPFGYEKDPKDRHQLKIVKEEAVVVKRIFDLTMQGYTSGKIAKLLNQEGIKTPIEFKIAKGATSRIPKGERFFWTKSTICSILSNQIYIGHIVQKKYTKDFVGGKNHLKPKEEWLISYNHHEPIIEKEIFDKIQKQRGKKRTASYHQTHLLTGKLICGCCKKNLRYRRGANPYFDCSYRYSNGMENCVQNINVMFLEQYILFMLQQRFENIGEIEKLHNKEINCLKKEIKKQKEQRKRISIQIENLKQKNFDMYQKYVQGKISDFQSCDSQIKKLELELSNLNENIDKLEDKYLEMKKEEKGKNKAKSTNKINIPNKENKQKIDTTISELSKELLDSYIEKIVVYNEKQIEIFWKE